MNAGLVAVICWAVTLGELPPWHERACGQSALQVIAELCEVRTSTEEVDYILPCPGGECSAYDIEQAAHAIGLHGVAVNWGRELPSELSVPAILPVTGSGGRRHFVVLVRTTADQAQIIDYPHDPVWISSASLEALDWPGIALHLSADPGQIEDLRGFTQRRWRVVILWGTACAIVVMLGVSLRSLYRRKARAVV